MHPSEVVRKYVRAGMKLSERYEIEDFIGSGAYGSIFSAIDTITMERVAVKALPPPDHGVNATALGRFKREMKVIASLRHSNVINLYDYGETAEEIVFMVMEFVDGPTLYDLVVQRRFNVQQALSVTRQIAQGLGAAHDLGVIHRDLKPQNIMLVAGRDGDYHVKVLDFGMAKLLERINDESIIQLTREGVAVGTPRYIAPEQARGKKVGPYSDIYALGLLMYEMFTGARAVKADSVESAIMAHVAREPLKLEEIDDVPAEVQPLLWKMIEKNQKKRFQTADEVIDEIRRLEATLAGRPFSPSKPAKKSAEQPTPDESRIHSIHSSENLRVDVKRVKAFELNQKRTTVGSVKTPPKRFTLRLPSTRQEQFETVVCLLLAPVAFTTASAHFYESGFFLRFLVGALPSAVAIVAAVLARSIEWRWSIVRLWLIASIFTVIASHLLLEQLCRGLIVDPIWYLDPFTWFPGVQKLQSGLSALARAHVSAVMGFSPELAQTLRHVRGNP